jgi:hypothetical protein
VGFMTRKSSAVPANHHLSPPALDLAPSRA